MHTAGLLLWFWALPHVPLADMTAIGFTGPIFIMAGAVVFLGEPMVRARWIAAGIGFLGVMVVVAPQFTGRAGWLLVAGDARLGAAVCRILPDHQGADAA